MNRRPEIEAHRGDSANAPENTMAAFRRAVALGVDSIELDVHPARDGVLMVIHDATLKRTTDGNGAVVDHSSQELRALSAGAHFAPAFDREPIPRLDEVLTLLQPGRTRLNIEIKGAPRGMDVPGAVVDLLRRFGKEREYVVSSFDVSLLLRVRALAPEISLAPIGEASAILPEARRHQFPWIHAHHLSATAEHVAEAHRSGVRVNIWTLDDPARLAHWKTIGVDKICTNRPEAMLTALAETQAG